MEQANQGRFKTIEEAYLDFRLRVAGFCALHKKGEDPFYNKENMAELERRVKDIESGNATLTEYELMEA